MTEQQISALGPDFDNYLQQFDLCCNHPATFRLLGVYCRGLLSPLPRKSAEPIALAAGVAVRTLQEFLRDHRWSYQLAREALHQAVIADLATFPDEGLGNIGVVDETSVAKKGTKTPGVQRQWCGAVGKVENCIVTVHLGVARGRYKTLIDAELFLPESWADDPERCAEADIPEGREHQPKWQLALRQILRARVTGFTFDWMTFDEGYGSKPGRTGSTTGTRATSARCHATSPASAVRPEPARREAGWRTWLGTARRSIASRGKRFGYRVRRWGSRSGWPVWRRSGCVIPTG